MENIWHQEVRKPFQTKETASLTFVKGNDGNIWIISSKDGDLQTIQSNQDVVQTVKWMKAGQPQEVRLLLSAGSNGTIKLWRMIETTGFRLVQSVTVTEHQIEDIDVFGTKLVVVGTGGIFFYEVHPYAKVVFEPINRVLETVTGNRIQTDLGKIRGVRFFNQGNSVVVGMLQRVIIGWDLPTGKRMFRERIETRIGNMEWCEEARKLAVWNLDDGVDVYDIQDTLIATPIKIPLNVKRLFPIQVRFLTEEMLVIGSDNGTVVIASILSRSVIKKLRHEDMRE
ncbi:WD40-repeat-containing domain protein [Ephemerocybe angulata]|uniref:WD40-repeat-containing domain protein n=1 Tax=Ephemerocybe angulata TaxID=980116 RepID=A0A8H6H7Y7_9AGAR|nr:WD40-repeat-containing domain protein [Tulosesus angulatus]